MSTRLRLAVLLLSGVALGFAITPIAAAQSCMEQARAGAVMQGKELTVSIEELRIPRKAWDHYEKARAASVSGNAGAFEREAGIALAIAPTFADVYILRAGTQNQAGRYEAAIESIRAARAIRPKVTWSAVVVAGALNGLKRFDEASVELDRAGVYEAQSWQWKYERTRAELGRQDVTKALHWSERVLEAMPAGCQDGRLLRSNALELAGRPLEAIEQLEAYLAGGDKLMYHDQVVRVLGRIRKEAGEENVGLLATK